MSEQGWILDVFSLEIPQNNVQKVSFCAERHLDTNFVNFGGPRSSLRELLEAWGGGRKPSPSRERVREAPGQAYKS